MGLILWLLGTAVGWCGPGDFTPPSPDGPRVPVEIDDAYLCVDRKAFHPWELVSYEADHRPLSVFNADGSPRRGYLPIRLIGPTLRLVTDQEFGQLVKGMRDEFKGAVTSDSIAVDLIPQQYADARATSLTQLFELYQTDVSNNHSFKSRKRRADCVSKRYGAGCCLAIELGPECVHETLNYEHPLEPAVILRCGTQTCSSNPLQHAGVHYQYHFPLAMMSEWILVHERIKQRISKWRSDQRCVAGS